MPKKYFIERAVRFLRLRMIIPTTSYEVKKYRDRSTSLFLLAMDELSTRYKKVFSPVSYTHLTLPTTPYV